LDFKRSRRHRSAVNNKIDEFRELELIISVFESELRQDSLAGLLGHLNAMTDHRFTGVYRFEPGWVLSVALFDRENPTLRLGADVKMKESYCWMAGLDGATLTIEDATTDERLAGHAARDEVRSYIAVLLRDVGSRPWGTLCHFDFAPRIVRPETLQQLERFRPLLEEAFIREREANWSPDAPSLPRGGGAS
jgi:GAF domain-containing protein